MKIQHSSEVVYGQMKTRQMGEWHAELTTEQGYIQKKRRLRNIALSTAAVFCLGIGAVNLATDREKAEQVMAHITADFEYDETLGRLQFVSNILPESAMVFLESNDEDMMAVFAPSTAEIIHAWNQAEPWLEYDDSGAVMACSDGEVMTVVQNRNDEYTVRILHENGYESVYSGLVDVSASAFDQVHAGEQIGQAGNGIAFELRKDGLSVMPEFVADMAGDK